MASNRPKPTPPFGRMRPKRPKPMPSGRRMHPKRPNPMPPCRRISLKRSNFDDSGSIWGSIFCFSMLQCASNSTCNAKHRTFVFAGRRGTSEGSQTLQKNKNRQTSTENRVDDALRTSRTKKIRCFCSWTRLGVDFGHRSRANLTF